MKIDLQWLCNELIGALVQGGLQGALIIGLIWGLLKLLPRANAATRHGAWLATLLVCAALPVGLFIISVRERATKEEAIAAPVPEPVMHVAEESEVMLPVAEEYATEMIEAEPVAVTSDSKWDFNWSVTLSKAFSYGIICAWLLLAAVRLGCLAAQLTMLRSIKRRAKFASADLADAFGAIVMSMKLSRRPRLLICEETTAPMVVGYLRPAMLLPRAIVARATNSQLEHLFRHELAHLARRDDWTNLIQQIVAAIFFFHPGILFVSRRLTAEREIACDDHALAIGRAPREYALFLTEFASQMKSRDFTAAPAAWSRNSQLKERIGMILNGKRNASPRVSRAGVGAMSAIAMVVAAAAFAYMPRLVVATEAPELPEAPEAPVALASAGLPAVPPQPVTVSVPVVSATPSAVTVASASPQPRVSVSVNTPQGLQSVQLTPKPVRIATADSGGEPGRPKKIRDRGDDDLEHRLDRLERMVEDLVRHDKQNRANVDSNFKNNFNFNDEKFQKEFSEQIARAQRDAERARHDAERAVREQKMAMETHMNAQRDYRIVEDGNRNSLKERRKALEAQRKSIEKEIQAIEKQMQKEDEKRDMEKRDLDKRKEEKSEKKRDKGEDSDGDRLQKQ